MGSDEERSKKEKREARSPEDAAAREVRKAAKRAKKEGGGGGGEGVSGGADGAVARVRVSPVPPSSDAAAIAAFLGVDAAKVVVLSNEATAIMPDADAAANAASTLDETKFKGRFVRVIRDDFKPDAVAVAADAHDAGEDEVRERAERARQPPSRRDDAGEARGDVVEVDCAGQTGRIIGKGGSKIREIEELTGCVLRVRQEEGVCEVSGRDVNAAVQEIKNIVQEGRERDGGGGAVGGAFAGGSREPASAPPRADAAAASRPFGVPPPGSASRHDTGANDWTCACGSVNFARRTACFGCHAPRRANGADASRLAEPPGGRVPAGSKPAAAAARAPAQGHDDDGYEVFVKYLPHETSEAEVGAFFAENFGPLKGDVRLIRDRNGRCKGAGFVTFASEASRAECLRRDGARFGGRHISVSVAKTGTFGVRATEQKVGTHTPAMLRETLDALVLADPRGVYVDGTFGRGGHSRGILGALAPEGRLHAFDMDPEVRTRRGPDGRSFSTRREVFFGTRRARPFRGFRFFRLFPRHPPQTRRDENTIEPRKLSRTGDTRVATNQSPIEIERRMARMARRDPTRPDAPRRGRRAKPPTRARAPKSLTSARSVLPRPARRDARRARIRRPSPRVRNSRHRTRGSRFTTLRSGAWTKCWRRWASARRACSWTSASRRRSLTTRAADSAPSKTGLSICASTSRRAYLRLSSCRPSIATS